MVEKQVSPLRCASVEMTALWRAARAFLKCAALGWRSEGVEGLISRVDSLLANLLRGAEASSTLWSDRSSGRSGV